MKKRARKGREEKREKRKKSQCGDVATLLCFSTGRGKLSERLASKRRQVKRRREFRIKGERPLISSSICVSHCPPLFPPISRRFHLKKGNRKKKKQGGGKKGTREGEKRSRGMNATLERLSARRAFHAIVFPVRRI